MGVMKKRYKSSKSIAKLVYSVLLQEDDTHRFKEHAWAVGLSPNWKVLYVELVSLGTLDMCITMPRDVFRQAITFAGAYIIIVHNHPTDSSGPSNADKVLTKKMVRAGEILGIPLVDHIIIGNDGSYFSFYENGLIDKYQTKGKARGTE